MHNVHQRSNFHSLINLSRLFLHSYIRYRNSIATPHHQHHHHGLCPFLPTTFDVTFFFPNSSILPALHCFFPLSDFIYFSHFHTSSILACNNNRLSIHEQIVGWVGKKKKLENKADAIVDAAAGCWVGRPTNSTFHPLSRLYRSVFLPTTFISRILLPALPPLCFPFLDQTALSRSDHQVIEKVFFLMSEKSAGWLCVRTPIVCF